MVLKLIFLVLDEVTEDDIRNLARQMLKSKPCVASLGLLERLPEFKEIITSGEFGDVLKQADPIPSHHQ